MGAPEGGNPHRLGQGAPIDESGTHITDHDTPHKFIFETRARIQYGRLGGQGHNFISPLGRGCNVIVDRKNTKYKRMSAAQTKARARFKAAVKEAGKLRKKNPKLSQADAVKQAFAQLYGKKKTGKKLGDFTRSGTKVKDKTGKTRFKKPDYSVSRTPEGTFKKWKTLGATPKKSAPKKPATHSDSKSHNVNIRVMSGILKTYIVLFDTGHNFETVKIQAVDMRAARAMASRVKRDDPKLKKARTSVRLFRK